MWPEVRGTNMCNKRKILELNLKKTRLLMSNFSLVLNVVFFLLVIPPRLDFIYRRFGTLSVPSS
jgi:hypothetical protein